jgi:hypothetical protein
VADILEKYGIASAIDVSELKQDDFIALEDLGLKPFMLMKMKRWSTSGGVTCLVNCPTSESLHVNEDETLVYIGGCYVPRQLSHQ